MRQLNNGANLSLTKEWDVLKKMVDGVAPSGKSPIIFPDFQCYSVPFLELSRLKELLESPIGLGQFSTSIYLSGHENWGAI